MRLSSSQIEAIKQKEIIATFAATRLVEILQHVKKYAQPYLGRAHA